MHLKRIKVCFKRSPEKTLITKDLSALNAAGFFIPIISDLIIILKQFETFGYKLQPKTLKR